MKTKCEFYFGNVEMNRIKLFEAAITSAEHGKVLYIMQEELEELPLLPNSLKIDRHYLKMISFLYAKTFELLIGSISSLYSWTNIPNTIILENLNDYCNENNIQDACGVVALLTNTAQSCAESANKPCKLYISASEQDVGIQYCTVLRELYS